MDVAYFKFFRQFCGIKFGYEKPFHHPCLGDALLC